MQSNRTTEIDLRPLRTTKTPSGASAPVHDDHHASLGRLLRLVADPRSDASHMEAAIDHHCKTQRLYTRAALALSDHKHISNLTSVVAVIDRAIVGLGESTNDQTTARNLLQAFALALVTQSVHETSSTKHNACLWTARSNKRLVLLEWILQRHIAAFNVVVNDVLVVALAGDKTSQLTACLVIFELAQRCRRQDGPLQGDWSILLNPLVNAVRLGAVDTATGPKPSKLGVAALDALAVVLCLTGASTTQQTRILECMYFVLSTLLQWHARSARRQWLLDATRHLTSLVAMSEADTTREAFDMVVWQWNASAMWFCSRSESVLSVKKTVADAVAQTIEAVYAISRATERVDAVQHKAVPFLHRLCALFSLHTGTTAELLPTGVVQGKLLIALASLVSPPATRALSLSMMRRLLLGQSSSSDQNEPEPVIVLSREEAQAFISMLQGQRRVLGDGVTAIVAELCLRSGIPTLDGQSTGDPPSAQFWLSIAAQALDLHRAIFSLDQALQTQWLGNTTKAVLDILHYHPNQNVRTRAATLIPELDLVMCMQFVVSSLVLEIDSTTSGRLVAMIFHCAIGQEALFMELADTLVDTLCRGVPAHVEVASPTGFGDVRSRLGMDGEQDQASILSKSREGWCMQLDQVHQTMVLKVLVRKVFGSPRDSVLVTWLRELSLLGWFDAAVADILPIVTTHMKGLERLTEELLEDDSPRGSRAVEHLLFARLAPCLVLRVIPRSAFHSLCVVEPPRMLIDEGNVASGPLHDLAHVLWTQVLDPLEYKDVKMLSIELLTKFPVHEILPRALEQLVAFAHSQGAPSAVVKLLARSDTLLTDGGFVTAKLLVYYLNLIFSDESSDVQDDSLLDKTLCVLLTLLSLPCASTEAFSAAKSPLVDLQMGTIECLSLLVAKSIKQTQKRSGLSELQLVEDALLQVLLTDLWTDAPPQHSPSTKTPLGQDRCLRMFSLWKSAVFDSCLDHERFSLTQLRICCCNVLLSALGKLDADGTATFQDRVLRTNILRSMQQLPLPPPVLAGYLQIVFSYFFKAGAALQQDDPSSEELTDLSIAAVIQVLTSGTQDDAVSMNALKALGALIGKVPWLWPSLASKGDIQQTIAAGLQTLRDSTQVANPAVRQLAQSLLQAMFSS